MAQIKIYGLAKHLNNVKTELSKTIHQTIVDVLSFPKEKRFHRFITFEQDYMLFPEDKSEQYTIIEIMMMEGRTVETKKKLIRSLFEKIDEDLNIAKNDIEICIMECPASNWGFRGMTGDEVALNYTVEV